MRKSLAFAALAATTALATPAAAQQVTANAEARGLIIQPLTLVKLQDLNFGTIVASGTAGSVTMSPDGTRSAAGGATLAPSGPGSNGLFEGYGSAGQAVSLSFTAPTMLVHPNGTDAVAFSNFLFDANNAVSRTIGLTGSFRVGVGGTIAVGANQTPGLYRAPFTVTANYQ